MNVKITPATATKEQELAFKATIKNVRRNNILSGEEQARRTFSIDWVLWSLAIGLVLGSFFGYIACLIRSL